jgi:hypothetical protein
MSKTANKPFFSEIQKSKDLFRPGPQHFLPFLRWNIKYLDTNNAEKGFNSDYLQNNFTTYEIKDLCIKGLVYFDFPTKH